MINENEDKIKRNMLFIDTIKNEGDTISVASQEELLIRKSNGYIPTRVKERKVGEDKKCLKDVCI